MNSLTFGQVTKADGEITLGRIQRNLNVIESFIVDIVEHQGRLASRSAQTIAASELHVGGAHESIVANFSILDLIVTHAVQGARRSAEKRVRVGLVAGTAMVQPILEVVLRPTRAHQQQHHQTHDQKTLANECGHSISIALFT